MRHPPPCRYDSSLFGIDPETDFCTCPTDKREEGYRKWLIQRIALINGRILQSQANLPETIALSGQLTAYKQMLNYAKTHGVA